MNKLLALVVGVALSLPLVGMMGGCTMTEDPSTHYRRVARNFDLENRELVEDVDTFFMTDQPSHLTPFEVPHPPGH